MTNPRQHNLRYYFYAGLIALVLTFFGHTFFSIFLFIMPWDWAGQLLIIFCPWAILTIIIKYFIEKLAEGRPSRQALFPTATASDRSPESALALPRTEPGPEPDLAALRKRSLKIALWIAIPLFLAFRGLTCVQVFSRMPSDSGFLTHLLTKPMLWPMLLTGLIGGLIWALPLIGVVYLVVYLLLKRRRQQAVLSFQDLRLGFAPALILAAILFRMLNFPYYSFFIVLLVALGCWLVVINQFALGTPRRRVLVVGSVAIPTGLAVLIIGPQLSWGVLELTASLAVVVVAFLIVLVGMGSAQLGRAERNFYFVVLALLLGGFLVLNQHEYLKAVLNLRGRVTAKGTADRSGVTVTLLLRDRTGERELATAITGPDGYYQFAGVRETFPFPEAYHWNDHGSWSCGVSEMIRFEKPGYQTIHLDWYSAIKQHASGADGFLQANDVELVPGQRAADVELVPGQVAALAAGGSRSEYDYYLHSAYERDRARSWERLAVHNRNESIRDAIDYQIIRCRYQDAGRLLFLTTAQRANHYGALLETIAAWEQRYPDSAFRPDVEEIKVAIHHRLTAAPPPAGEYQSDTNPEWLRDAIRRYED